MIYFITDGKYVRIGWSRLPEKRLLELQEGNPRKLTLWRTVPSKIGEDIALRKALGNYQVLDRWYRFAPVKRLMANKRERRNYRIRLATLRLMAIAVGAIGVIEVTKWMWT